MKAMPAKNRYEVLIEKIFFHYFKPGHVEIPFLRTDIEKFAKQLKIVLPKNLGDLIYTFRYRSALPASITKTAPDGKHWIIIPAGRAKYKFALSDIREFVPNGNLLEIKIPDATPGAISLYSLSDEQALLAKIRYNRLIDIFTRVTCYSLQSHLRTTVPGQGQVETDEIYIGIDRNGAHYVIPIQAKGGKDKLSPVQIQQDIELCAHKFPTLICRPVGAQFISPDAIALFEFLNTDDGLKISSEKHYKLSPPDNINEHDLRKYKQLLDDE